MDFLDNTVFSGNTDIQNINYSDPHNHSTPVYDLQGRCQYTTKNGLNIVNGKKVIIK